MPGETAATLGALAMLVAVAVFTGMAVFSFVLGAWIAGLLWSAGTVVAVVVLYGLVSDAFGWGD